MTLWRRVSAGFCALVLVVVLVAFPLRAYAMTATMAAVGGAVVVSAALVACGIYPYISEDGQTFGEWGARKLSDLWTQYVSSFEGGSLPSGGTVQTFEQIKAYITGQTLVISRSAWETLQSFTSWVKSTFSLTNYQTDVQLGVTSTDGYVSVFSGSGNPTLENFLASNTIYKMPYSSSELYYGYAYLSPVSGVVAGRVLRSDGHYWGYFASYSSVTLKEAFIVYRGNETLSHSPSTLSVSRAVTYGGETFFTNNSLHSAYEDTSIPSFSSENAFYQYFTGYRPTLSGVTADTSTLGALPDMAADADYMGLSVAPGTVDSVGGVGGVVATMTPQAVQEIIQQGVTDRERPVVTPVEVQLATDVEMDAETGVITDTSPVVIAPDTFPLSPGDYAIPSLSTVFPFSVPWDIARVFQALDAEPRFPLEDFTFTLDVPFLFGNSPPSISLGLEGLPQELSTKINDMASLVRNLALIAACIGWLIFITKFIRF